MFVVVREQEGHEEERKGAGQGEGDVPTFS